MKHERPEELPHIQDRTWVPILKEICDNKVPEEHRILLAKKVLRSGYVQAWVEVMEEYRRLQPDTRWGRENWMDKISGPIRLKALKVLQGHPGPSNRHWDAAIAALALCCKAKDIPTLLRICKLAIVDGKYELDPSDIGWCLGRIILWKPEQDYPELFVFLEHHLWVVDEHLRQEFFHLLLNSNHPRAESMLLAAIERGADTYWGLLGEWYLFLKDEAKYLERAQAALVHYAGLEEALFATEYLKYQSENALRNFEYEIDEFLEGDEEEPEDQKLEDEEE